jgi:hypothetical protein
LDGFAGFVRFGFGFATDPFPASGTVTVGMGSVGRGAVVVVVVAVVVVVVGVVVVGVVVVVVVVGVVAVVVVSVGGGSVDVQSVVTVWAGEHGVGAATPPGASSAAVAAPAVPSASAISRRIPVRRTFVTIDGSSALRQRSGCFCHYTFGRICRQN